MKRKSKKFTAVLLAVIMALSAFTAAPFTAIAATTVEAEVSSTSGDYEYQLLDDGTAEITDYNGIATELEIPSEIDGYTVTSIGDSSFYSIDTLVGVTIPDSITNIESYAFFGCSNLSGLVIPDSVTSIGYEAFEYTAWHENKPDGIVYAGKVVYEYKGEMEENTQLLLNYGIKGIADCAFEDCYRLTSITLPETLEAIGAYAFADTAISYVFIPKSVSCIDEKAFENCYLEQIAVDAENSAYSSSSGVLFNKNKTKIIRYPAGETFPYYTVPDGVTEIGRAFSSCNNLEKVYLPDSVTSIGEDAFAYSGVASVSLPDGVTSIGGWAFYSSALEYITIPDSVTYIGSGAFSFTPWYENKPDQSLIYAGKIAYKYKGEMPTNTSIALKEGTAIIQESAFYGCSGLVNIDIPDSVTEIGYGAFEGCDNLNSVAIPNGVTEIKYRTFLDCKRLESVTIGNSIKTIGEEVFKNCGSLKTVNIPQGVQLIDANAFEFCESMEKIVFPESLEEIGYRAFFSCDNLSEVTIPCGTNVSDSAFSICGNLKNVTITGSGEWSESFTNGYNSLLSDCENVVLQNGVTEICENAFSGCFIKNITIPQSVTHIGYWAFFDCASLTDVYYSGSEEEWKKIDVDGGNECLSNAAIHYNYTGEEPSSETTEPSTTEPEPTPDYKFADVNLDGNVNVKDATLIQRIVVEEAGLTVTDKQKELADINGDGTISVKDATALQIKIVNT